MTKKQDYAFLGALIFGGIATALKYEPDLVLASAFLGVVIGGDMINTWFKRRK